MPRKSLKRLAGCIVIELVCTVAAFAANYAYQAGYAAYGQAKALALEDRRGHRAVIVTAGFDVPLSVADSVAAQAMKEYGLERASILVYSVASGGAKPVDARTAIGAALGGLKPAVLVYGNGRLTVSSYDGRCLAGISAEASLEACTTPAGDSVGGQIRSALRVVDIPHALGTRETRLPRSVAVQTIAIGPVVIFSGPSNVAQSGKRIILAETEAVEDNPQLTVAAAEVFLRVGGRPH